MAMEHFEEKMVPILRGRIRTEEAEINSLVEEYGSCSIPDPEVVVLG
jgi:hypothetical protein